MTTSFNKYISDSFCLPALYSNYSINCLSFNSSTRENIILVGKISGVCHAVSWLPMKQPFLLHFTAFHYYILIT